MATVPILRKSWANIKRLFEQEPVQHRSLADPIPKFASSRQSSSFKKTNLLSHPARIIHKGPAAGWYLCRAITYDIATTYMRVV